MDEERQEPLYHRNYHREHRLSQPPDEADDLLRQLQDDRQDGCYEFAEQRKDLLQCAEELVSYRPCELLEDIYDVLHLFPQVFAVLSEGFDIDAIPLQYLTYQTVLALHKGEEILDQQGEENYGSYDGEYLCVVGGKQRPDILQEADDLPCIECKEDRSHRDSDELQ